MMEKFHQELSERISQSVGYAAATNTVFEAYISALLGEASGVDRQTSKRLSTTIQHFYLSGEERFVKEGATLLSMLLYISGRRDPELVAIAESAYTQVGDFPNVELLKRTFENVNVKLSLFDQTKRHLRLSVNTVEEIDHPLTDYQRTLWEDLMSDEDVITSAPTSTGKTDIILRYLLEKLMEREGAFAVIVVPTRALISEVAKKIYDLAKEKRHEKSIEICTVPKEGPFCDRTFFVMTQERLFEVLQSGAIYFNFLFVDEAHNISDNSRGVLLHLTLQKLLEDSNPQIIISMPSHKYLKAFDSVFEDINFKVKKTKHSPVVKIMMHVSFKGKNIIISRLNTENKTSVPKKFNGTKLADIVFRLGQGESNIIYRNQTHHCEDTADDISDLIAEPKGSAALEEAADYVERFLHKDFSLASNLRKGVAFHYGPLPTVTRTMIEDLVREGEIEYVVCTSTLAEGVNLPAKNLFLTNPTYRPPYQEATRLEEVKLDNITGRAGRMLKHFSGNVFLIEHEKWKYQDYFDEKERDTEDRIPTYFKIINDDVYGVVNAIEGNYDHNLDNQYSYYTIANKLLREYSSDVLHRTIESDALSISHKDRKLLETSVKKAYESLKVDTFTLEASPTVGFIQQNKLYNTLLNKSDLSEWLLPHPLSADLYNKLIAVATLLNDNGIFIPSHDNSITHICYIAKKWIAGEPLKSIIGSQINYDYEQGLEYNCNRSVRNIIKTINTDVRFRLASALRCYHSLITDVIGSKRLELQSIKIHSFIEVGSCEDRIINLVNLGLSRETALEINKTVPKGIEIKSVTTLKKLFEEGKALEKLHVITKREIMRIIA